VNQLGISKDNNFLAAANELGMIKVYNLNSSQHLTTRKYEENEIDDGRSRRESFNFPGATRFGQENPSRKGSNNLAGVYTEGSRKGSFLSENNRKVSKQLKE